MRMSKLDWSPKTCPKCGGEMDSFRSMIDGSVGFYECRKCPHLERGKYPNEAWENLKRQWDANPKQIRKSKLGEKRND